MIDQERLNLARQALPGDRPCGDDLSMTEDFLWLEKEVAKASTPILVSDATETKDGEPHFKYADIDWHRVVDLCSNLLATKSKDLRLLLWLTQGLIAIDGLPGIAVGIDLSCVFVEQFWDKLHPARPVGRANAVMRIRDCAVEALEGKARVSKPLPLKPEHRAVMETILASVPKLQSLLQKRLAEQESLLGRLSMGRLEQALSKGIKSLATPPAEPVKTPPSAAAAATSFANSSATTVTPSGEAIVAAPTAGETTYDFSAPGERGRYFRDLQPVARALHTAGLSSLSPDPLPYRWIRIVYWLPVKYDQAVKQIPAAGPNEVLRKRLEELWQQQQWADLFREAERQFTSFFFWLDLQRYVCDAMRAMGQSYEPARQGVLLETEFLLRRMPHFVSLESQDRIPVAAETTRGWLESLRGEFSASDAGAPLPETVRDSTAAVQKPETTFQLNETVTACLERARKLLGGSGSGQESFEIHFRLSEYLLQKKETLLAYGYLEELGQQIDLHRLDRWDPKLAVRTWRLLHRCYLQMMRVRKEDSRHFQSLADKLINRVSLVDPPAAEAMARQ